MDKKKIVIALGGNALGNNLPEQMEAVKTTAKAIVDLAEDGNEIVIVHGNGPQVGVINNAMTEFAHKDGSDPTPLSVCVAMSQAYIGYDIQNALREEFLNRGAKLPPVATMVTQVRVDPEDPAFRDPSKPIGRFMSKDEALKEAGDRGWIVREDAGRGYRRVVASPKPKEIIELSAIRAMADDGQIVIKKLVEPEILTHTVMSWLKNHTLSAAASHFVDLFREMFAPEESRGKEEKISE